MLTKPKIFFLNFLTKIMDKNKEIFVIIHNNFNLIFFLLKSIILIFKVILLPNQPDENLENLI